MFDEDNYFCLIILIKYSYHNNKCYDIVSLSMDLRTKIPFSPCHSSFLSPDTDEGLLPLSFMWVLKFLSSKQTFHCRPFLTSHYDFQAAFL